MKKKSKTLRREAVITQFGQHLRKLRSKLEISQQELSDLSGITVTYISKIENGKFNTSLSHLAAIAEALKLTLHELLNFSSKKL
jgi:transcriptional regulator with XRE-family HTH domain